MKTTDTLTPEELDKISARVNAEAWDDDTVVKVYNDRAKLLAHIRAKCIWTQEGDSDWNGYHGSCGIYFILANGTPPENFMHFCPQCGGHMVYEPQEQL